MKIIGNHDHLCYETVVYFIQQGIEGPIKIGYSKGRSFRSRLSALQIANPEKLHLIKLLEGNFQDETTIHHQLHDYHIRGEWYQNVIDVIEYSPDPITFNTTLKKLRAKTIFLPPKRYMMTRRSMSNNALLLKFRKNTISLLLSDIEYSTNPFTFDTILNKLRANTIFLPPKCYMMTRSMSNNALLLKFRKNTISLLSNDLRLQSSV